MSTLDDTNSVIEQLDMPVEYYLVQTQAGKQTELKLNLNITDENYLNTNTKKVLIDGKTVAYLDMSSSAEIQDYRLICSELANLFEIRSSTSYKIKTSDNKAGLIKRSIENANEIAISLNKIIKKLYQKIQSGELKDDVFVNGLNSIQQSSFGNPITDEKEIKKVVDVALYAISKSFVTMTAADFIKCKKNYLQMILFDYIVGQTKRTFDSYSVVVDKESGAASFGGMTSFDCSPMPNQQSSEYVLNTSVVNRVALINTIYKNYYSEIAEFSRMISTFLNDYKKSIELIIKNNSQGEYTNILSTINANVDFLSALESQYHVEGNKIESTQTNIGIQLKAKKNNNDVLAKYPEVETPEELMVEFDEESVDDGIKLSVEPTPQANGFVNKLLVILFIAFICGVGVGVGFVLFRLSGI